MKKILVTGSLGLVGSEAVRYYLNENWQVFGVDNDMRRHFFGDEASVIRNKIDHPNYRHIGVDISKTEDVFKETQPDVIIHAAAQPSHDYSAKEPLLDFGVNAYATLMLLEMTRKHAPEAVFIYLSTNKVYGDWPNMLPNFLKGSEKRYEVAGEGFDETTPIDCCLHSPFGVSKLTGDLYAQEYARYYGLKTGIFRCGCITGSRHTGVELHGFLSYMAACKKTKRPYKVYGFKGKQVRDQIHAHDLIRAIDQFVQEPRPGEVYNMGGGRHANVSVLEALKRMKIKDYEYVDEARKGDHKWYISDVSKFKQDYPEWKYEYDMEAIYTELMG